MACCCAVDPNAVPAESISAETPVRRPAAAAGRSGASGAAPEPAASAGDLEMILQDLEIAEDSVYMQIFETFGPGDDGKVSAADEPMRGFLQRAIGAGLEVDLVINEAGAFDAGGLSLAMFIEIIREHAISQDTAMEDYFRWAGEQATPEDCRTALRSLVEQHLAAQFSEDQWDKILTTVMEQVGTEVPIDVWILLVKHCARIVRLIQLRV